MLYTGKGDKGDTGVYGCDQRISKSSAISEALGALDEINSFLGLCKVKAQEKNLFFGEITLFDIIHSIQKDLFIIQAEVAGTSMTISESKVKQLEEYINTAEKALPPIHSFFISGGAELTALFDMARTIARRAERRVVAVKEENLREIGEYSLSYLNRLSSLLYALARLVNHNSGIKEQSPDYK